MRFEGHTAARTVLRMGLAWGKRERRGLCGGHIEHTCKGLKQQGRGAMRILLVSPEYPDSRLKFTK